jgi:hypothetical protein
MTTKTLTHQQIAAMRDEAAAARDYAMVDTCTRAISGDEAAAEVVARAIADAAAMDDEAPVAATEYGLALYEHDETYAAVIDRDGVALDRHDAPECDAHGWGYSVGDTIEIDGRQCRLTHVSGDIQTGDTRGNFVEAIARVIG